MVITLIPVLVAIVGALVYALSANGKAAEMGRLAFAIGLFFTVSALAAHVVRLG